MNRKPTLFATGAILFLTSLWLLGDSKINAQEAIVTQVLPPIAPAPETPFARALTRLDDLEAQIRALTDRLERAEAEINSQKAENTRLAKLLDETKASNILSADKSKPNPEPMQSAQAEVAKTEPAAPQAIGANSETEVKSNSMTSAILPAETPPIAVRAVTAPAPVLPAASAPLTTPKAAPASTPAVALKPAPILLSEAKLMLQRSEFAAAESQLALLTESYPDAGETPEGLWLLGETRFVQKAYNSAALAYVAYLGKAPTGPRVSDTLLRLSSSFREIGDNRQRCLAFKEYQKRTPSPTPLQTARANAELAKGPCT